MGYTWPISSFAVVLVIFAAAFAAAMSRPKERREGLLVRAAFAAIVVGIPAGYPLARWWMRHVQAPPSEVFWSDGPSPVVWVVDEMPVAGGRDVQPRVTIVDLDSGNPILLNGSFDEPNLVGRTADLFWVEDYSHRYAAFDARTGRMKTDLAALQAADPRLASLAKEPLAGFDGKTRSIRFTTAEGAVYAVDPSFQVAEAPKDAPDPGATACAWRESAELRFQRPPEMSVRGAALALGSDGRLTVARGGIASADVFSGGRIVVDDAACRALLLDGPESALVVSPNGAGGTLTRVSLADGSTVWSKALDAPPAGVVSATVAGGDVAIVERHGAGWRLTRFAPDGTERWRFDD